VPLGCFRGNITGYLGIGKYHKGKEAKLSLLNSNNLLDVERLLKQRLEF
jgi:hypothetical protein